MPARCLGHRLENQERCPLARKPVELASLGTGLFHKVDGRWFLLSSQEAAYLRNMGKRPPLLYSEAQWPSGPIKAKKLAIKMVEETNG